MYSPAGQEAQPIVEPPTPTQALDCLHKSSSGLVASGGDQDGNSKVQKHGEELDGSDSFGMKQKQEVVGRNQEPEQQQGHQGNPTNTIHSENIENQATQTPDCNPVPTVMVTNLEEVSKAFTSYVSSLPVSVIDLE